MNNKYRDWIDIIKTAASALFVAFLAQIANLFYTNEDLYTKIYLYCGLTLTFTAWLICFKCIEFFNKKGHQNGNISRN